MKSYVAADLYIGTVEGRSVAMAPSVADAGGQGEERLASSSSQSEFGRWLFCAHKGSRVPRKKP